MKHIRKFNEAKADKLLQVEELDLLIKEIFLDLIDKNWSLEVNHHNGCSFYTILPPNDHSRFLNKLEASNNLKLDHIYEDISPNFDSYINTLSEINEVLLEIRGRVMDIPGVDEFDINSRCNIDIRINNIPQGYENLGNVMLAGDQSRSVYR